VGQSASHTSRQAGRPEITVEASAQDEAPADNEEDGKEELAHIKQSDRALEK
jgi:hypothetical protein